MTSLSIEHKRAISDGLTKAHLENRHPGWQSSNRKHKSYPEKLFEHVARKNGLFEKYQILEQYPFHGYFFDFAIIDCLLDLEIDGVQHYRTDKAIEYDKSRNEFVMSKGWKVYRISAKQLKDDPVNEITKLLKFIELKKQYHCYSKEDLLKYFNGRKIGKYGTRKEYFNQLTKEYEEKNKKLINEVLTSNIDFSKFGWVNKVSVLINQKPPKVNKWMKRFMPEFFENECFKKNKRI